MKTITKYFKWIIGIIVGFFGLFKIFSILTKEKIPDSTPVIHDVEDEIIDEIIDEQKEEKVTIEKITKESVLTPEVIEQIKNGGLTEKEMLDIDEKLVGLGTSLEKEVDKILNMVEKI